jgi:hypothetical protein
MRRVTCVGLLIAVGLDLGGEFPWILVEILHACLAAKVDVSALMSDFDRLAMLA